MANLGDLNKEQEEALKEAYISFLKAEKLSDLWDAMVEYIPRITGWTDIVIYLRKEYISDFSWRNLVTSDGITLSEEPKGDYVVLANTSLKNKKHFIGRAFYPAGVGFTGKTYALGKGHIIRNVNDEKDLHERYPYLERSDLYGLLTEKKGMDTSMLLVPLKWKSLRIGVLKLYTDREPRKFSNEFLVFVQDLIDTVVNEVVQKQRLIEQEGIILSLAELSGQENIEQVLHSITKTIKDFLKVPYCQIYLSDESNLKVVLQSTNGGRPTKADARSREQGLIGWIFKTGRPLIIDDIHQFDQPVEMTHENLERYSDGEPIDQDATYCQDQPEKTQNIHHKIPFIGVPIRCCGHSNVMGVLCIHYLSDRYEGEPGPFDRDELKRLFVFAKTLAIALHNDLLRRRNAFLTDLSKIWVRNELYEKIAKGVPDLVSASHCFVFIQEIEPSGRVLRLKHSDKPVKLPDYQIGIGKTGFCGLVRKTVVFSHFGAGRAGQDLLRRRKEVIDGKYTKDLVGFLHDQDWINVGIVQIWDGKSITEDELNAFQRLIHEPVSKDGLGSEKMESYKAGNAGASYSFIATPIIHSNRILDGVITVGRPIPGIPFNGEDVQFIQNMATTVGAILDNFSLREQQQNLVQTLAHEINTPLAAIRVETEQLVGSIEEVGQNTSEEIRQLHSEGKQLQRQFSDLQMLTDTVLALQGNRQPEFSRRSIHNPIMSAIALYSDWAREEGIRINPPEALGYPNFFPEIEMDIRTMDLVFKNLLHNAIKYSYKPTERSKTTRFINIVGTWHDHEHKRYQVSIENYGVPIADEEKANIFRPGYRGIYAKQRNRRGAGMGLSLVKYVVEEVHNGKVFVESKPVDGGANLTRFYVVLPIIHL